MRRRTPAPISHLDRFMPHRYCDLWEPEILWPHVGSDALIGLAYVAISVTLAFFVCRPDVRKISGTGSPGRLFIVACGFTHCMGIWAVWEPRNWLSRA